MFNKKGPRMMVIPQESTSYTLDMDKFGIANRENDYQQIAEHYHIKNQHLRLKNQGLIKIVRCIKHKQEQLLLEIAHLQNYRRQIKKREVQVEEKENFSSQPKWRVEVNLKQENFVSEKGLKEQLRNLFEQSRGVKDPGNRKKIRRELALLERQLQTVQSSRNTSSGILQQFIS